MICNNGPITVSILYFCYTVFKEYYSDSKYFSNNKTTRSNFDLSTPALKKNQHISNLHKKVRRRGVFLFEK